jgi:hypothetical protein
MNQILIALMLVLTTVILFTITTARAIVPLKLVAGNFASINANQANTNQAKSNYGDSLIIDP